MNAALPSRRAVLGGAGLVLLTGCTSGSGPSDDEPLPVDPDDAVRTQAADRERRLLDAYDRAQQALPDQAVLLAGLRAQHEQHLALLVEPAPSPPVGAASSTASASPTASAPAVSRTDLARLERDSAAAHTDAALAARDAGLASLLASIAASEASHPVELA